METAPEDATVPDPEAHDEDHRWERIPRDATGEIEAGDFQKPPDIAVEIVSPDQSPALLAERCRWYVAHGASVALVVNPAHRTVTRLGRATEPITLRGAARIDLDAVLPGFELTVDELFAALRLAAPDEPVSREADPSA